MPRKLKIWNGRGHGEYDRGHFYVAAHTKKTAARMLALLVHPALKDRPADLEFHTNRLIREMSVYYSAGVWGTPMAGVTPEPGVWASRDMWDKPVRVL
jgi:hypothetical protein